MSKNLGILGIVALGLFLASTGAFAHPHDGLWKVNIPTGEVGDMYDRTTVLPEISTVYPLPYPQGKAEPQPVLSQQGPSDQSGSLMSAEPSLAMITARGAAMSSPKQMADRQIKRLIRRLD